MSALDDAREAIHRSDERQVPMPGAETRAIRDALRALVQHVGDLELRIEELESRVVIDG